MNKRINKIIYVLGTLMFFVISLRYLPKISEKVTVKIYRAVSRFDK